MIIHSLKPPFSNTDLQAPDLCAGVLAIGNFDAVHRGHQALLETARKKALQYNLTFDVLTFEPHPRSLFRPDTQPFRVTPYAQKIERLTKAKADHVFVLDFTWDTAHLSAQNFIDQVLIQSLKKPYIVVGSDFHFGHERAGSISMLQNQGFHCTVLEPLCDKRGDIYSATRIRSFLSEGDIAKANRLLGWEWAIAGKVEHGQKQGRELGYKTSNIAFGNTIHPSYGVYASYVEIEKDPTRFLAATNIGIRPMFESPVALVEAHILDFDQDIYGKNIKVFPVQKLRGEEKFASLDLLKEQMAKDCQRTRQILAKDA
jgi:riboflavin kinase / FMN adenylyltransferase